MKGKNKVMKTKTKSLNDVYKKIIACVILVAMFSVYVLPLQNVFAEDNEYEIIYSSSRELLTLMRNQINLAVWKYRREVSDAVPENPVPDVENVSGREGLYQIRIPNKYGNAIFRSSLLNEFNFSGQDLSELNDGPYYRLPDFSKFVCVKSLDFTNCNIEQLVAFEDALTLNYFARLPYNSIKLGNNTVKNDQYAQTVINSPKVDPKPNLKSDKSDSRNGNSSANTLEEYWIKTVAEDPNGNSYYKFECIGSDCYDFLEQLQKQIEQAYKNRNSNKTPVNAPFNAGDILAVDKTYFNARTKKY